MKGIAELIHKAQDFPELAHIYALEVDRQLRAIGEKAITFSAIGLEEGSIDRARTLKIDHLFFGKARGEDTDAIYQAELFIKEGCNSKALAHAFSLAHGQQVNSLNLFYANHTTQRPEVRRYYLNKYLSFYGLSIELEKTKSKDFFYRIKNGKRLEKVHGPLVTVIVPAHNAEATIDLSVNSLLEQSWRNLQIIIVDDASTDGTLSKAMAISKRDPRVEVLSNPVNVGTYVSRNLGVQHTRGEWLTVHDADDWAFPDRIEQQVNALTGAKTLTCTGGMLRMNAQGKITRPSPLGVNNEDAYQRLAFVSLMIRTEAFRKALGAWDSVRVGGDAELIERAKVLGIEHTHLRRPLMLCLDDMAGLTNHAELGLATEGGLMKKVRSDYRQAYRTWHGSVELKTLSPYAKVRPFPAPKANQIVQADIERVLVTKGKNPPPKPAGNLPLSKSKSVPLNANRIATSGDQTAAIEPTGGNPAADLAYTEHILHANAAIGAGNDTVWLDHINSYLAKFGAAPIHLEGEGSIFERLACEPLPKVTDGPLITVIMPAWNAERTVRKAAESILNQTWSNLELLIVDDCSSDTTWEIMQELAREDSRVKVHRNKVNVGPYVSKNLALVRSNGEWITGQDADDYSLPTRIEQHFKLAKASGVLFSTTAKIRMSPNGVVKNTGATKNSDGIAGQSFISCFFESSFLKNRLGAWDSVRFGGDGEIISRAKTFHEDRFSYFDRFISMICLDLPTGLTNNESFGITENGLSLPRKAYLNNYKKWHREIQANNIRLGFPLSSRPFPCDGLALVPVQDVVANFNKLWVCEAQNEN